MTQCEWTVKDSGPGPLEQETCKRTGHFSCMLDGSNSASNIWFMCWQHVKNYRRKRFVEQTFRKGTTVTILDLRGKKQ